MSQPKQKLTKPQRRQHHELIIRAIDEEIARSLEKDASDLKYHLLKTMGQNAIPPHHWVTFNEGTPDHPYSIEQEAYAKKSQRYIDENEGEPLPIPYQDGGSLDASLVKDEIASLRELGFKES